MEVNIRNMRESDIPYVAQLESQMFSDPWTEESIHSALKQDYVQSFVAQDLSGAIIGYHIFYTAIDEGDVARIGVAQGCRRLGVGDQLLDYTWNYCIEHEIKRVLLEVRKSNESAILLYKKHEFTSLGYRKGYYQNPLEDGVIMEKQIL